MLSLDYLVHAGALLFSFRIYSSRPAFTSWFYRNRHYVLRHLLSAPARAIMVRTFVE